jgi:hypothetical protein
MYADIYYETLRPKLPLRITKAEVRVILKRILLPTIEIGFMWVRQVPIVNLWKYGNGTLDKLINLLLS